MDNYYNLIISTASPYKFEDAINDSNIKLDYNNAPKVIIDALKNKNEKKVIDNNLSIEKIGEIVDGKN